LNGITAGFRFETKREEAGFEARQFLLVISTEASDPKPAVAEDFANVEMPMTTCQ